MPEVNIQTEEDVTIDWIDGSAKSFPRDWTRHQVYKRMKKMAEWEGHSLADVKEAYLKWVKASGEGYEVEVGFMDHPLTFYVDQAPDEVKEELLRKAREHGEMPDAVEGPLRKLDEERFGGQGLTDPIEFEDKYNRSRKFPWYTPKEDLLEELDKMLEGSEKRPKIQILGTDIVKEVPENIQTHEELMDKLDDYVPALTNYGYEQMENVGYKIVGTTDTEGDSEGRTSRFLKSAAETVPKFPNLIASNFYALKYMTLDSIGYTDLSGGSVEDMDYFENSVVEHIKNVYQGLPPEERKKAQAEAEKEYTDRVKGQYGKEAEEAANPYKKGTAEYWGFSLAQGLLNFAPIVGVAMTMGPGTGVLAGGTVAGSQRYASRSVQQPDLAKWQKALEAIVAGGAEGITDLIPLTALTSRSNNLIGRIAKAGLTKMVGESLIEESIIMGMDKITELTGTNDQPLGLRDALYRYAEAALLGLTMGGTMAGLTHIPVRLTKGLPKEIQGRNIGVNISEHTRVGELLNKSLQLDPIELLRIVQLAADAEHKGHSKNAILSKSYAELVDIADISKNLRGYPELQASLVGGKGTDLYKIPYRPGHEEADIKNRTYPDLDDAGRQALDTAISVASGKNKDLLMEWRDVIELSRQRVPIFEGEVERLKSLKTDFKGKEKKGLIRKRLGSAMPEFWESFPRQVRQMEDKNAVDFITKMYIDSARTAESRAEAWRTNIKKNTRNKADRLKLSDEDMVLIGKYAEAQQPRGAEAIYRLEGDRLYPQGTKQERRRIGRQWYLDNIEQKFLPGNKNYDKRLHDMYLTYMDHLKNSVGLMNNARILMGKKPVDVLDKYFPMMRMIADIRMDAEKRADYKNENYTMMHEIAFLERLKSTEQSYELARKGSTEPFKYLNAQHIFENYIDSVAEGIHKGPLISKLRVLTQVGLDDVPYFKTAANNWLNRQLGLQHDFLFRDPDTGKQTAYTGNWKIKGMKAKKWLNRIRNNLAIATIGYSPRTVFIQTGALVNTYADLGLADTYVGVLKAVDGDLFAEARNRSQALRQRLPEDVLQGMYKDMFRKMEKGGLLETAGTSYKAMQSHSVEALTAFDAFTATAAFLGAETHFIRKNQNKAKYKNNRAQLEADAVRFADNHVIKAHASVSDIDLSAGQKTDKGKLLATLQTFTLNQWQYITQDLMGVGMKKTPENFKKVFRYVLAGVASGVFWNEVAGVGDPEPEPAREFLKEGLGVGKPIKTKGKIEIPGNVVTGTVKALYEIMTQVPFFGGARYGGIGGFTYDWFTKAVTSGAQGSGWYMGEQVSKVAGIPQSHRVIRTIKNLLDEDKNILDVYTVWSGKTTIPGTGLPANLGLTEKTKTEATVKKRKKKKEKEKK